MMLTGDHVMNDFIEITMFYSQFFEPTFNVGVIHPDTCPAVPWHHKWSTARFNPTFVRGEENAVADDQKLAGFFRNLREAQVRP